MTCLENIQEAWSIAESRYPATRAPWDDQPTLQNVYYPPTAADGTATTNGVHEAYTMLAPMIVNGPLPEGEALSEQAGESDHTAAKAAAGMRLHNKDWCDAIDEAIVAWTKHFNKVFIQAQKSSYFASGSRPADLNAAWLYGTADEKAAAMQARAELQDKWDAATNDQTALRMWLENAFGEATAQSMCKAMDMLPTYDERPQPPLIATPESRAHAAVHGVDPRLRGRDYSDPRYHYHVCETNTTFYLALAADRCQIHAFAPVPLRGTYQGWAAAGELAEPKTLVQVPRIYDSGLCLFTTRDHMERVSCKLDIMTISPLDIELPTEYMPSTMWDATPPWHGVGSYENMKLAKACARHVGVGAPFSSERLTRNLMRRGDGGGLELQDEERRDIRAVFEKHEVDAGSQTTRSPVVGPLPVRPSSSHKRRRLAGEAATDAEVLDDFIAGDDDDPLAIEARARWCPVEDPLAIEARARWCAHARANRKLLMFDLPALGAPRLDISRCSGWRRMRVGGPELRLPTLQLMLGFGDYELRLAVADVHEERQAETATRVLVRRKHCELLRSQFSRLVRSDTIGGTMQDYSIATLDGLYPGVHRTVEVVMESVDFCKYEHVLDIAFVRELVRGIGMMTGPLAKYDEFFTNTRASGHAYCFVTGMSAGVLPTMTPTQIAERLHLDPLDNLARGQYKWLDIVKALWVFDAMQYERCRVRKVRSGVPASSNSFEWVVQIGEGEETIEIKGRFEPPVTREGWVDIRRMAVERTESLGWQATWPKVPLGSTMDEMAPWSPGEQSKPKRACNFHEVTAQQLIYWPKTRAQGIEVLTGNNLRGFIEACGSVDFPVENLASHVLFERGSGASAPEAEADDADDDETEEEPWEGGDGDDDDDDDDKTEEEEGQGGDDDMDVAATEGGEVDA